MNDRTKHTLNSRRNFMKLAFAGGGLARVAGVGAIAVSRPAGSSQGEPQTEAKPKGYRLTAHIQKYYEGADL